MAHKSPFEAVVDEYGSAVLRVCRSVLGRHVDADDAWSETFVAAMRAWPELPVDANVQAWLVTIAHRKALDITRRRSRQAVPSDDLPDQPSRLGRPEATDLDLWRAVRGLPDKQRQAIAYHYLGGLAYAEVATLIGGTTEAARRAASDGIARLRERMTP